MSDIWCLGSIHYFGPTPSPSCSCGKIQRSDVSMPPTSTPEGYECTDEFMAAFEAKGIDGVRELVPFCNPADYDALPPPVRGLGDRVLKSAAGEDAVLRVLQANQRAPAIGDYVRWDNPSTGEWIEGTLIDRSGPPPFWLAVLQVERGSPEYPARSIETVGVDDECTLRVIPQRQCRHQAFDQRVEIDEAAFHAVAGQLRAEQLAVSTGSVQMDTAAIRREFDLPPLRPDAIVVQNTSAGSVTFEQAAALDDAVRSPVPASSGRRTTWERRPGNAAPAPRPDGFTQSQVDAAKAALLAHVPRRGAK